MDTDGRQVVIDGSSPFSAALTNTGYDATTTSSVVIAANANRSQITIVNASDTAVYLAVGVAAVVGAGIYLAANGGSWTEAYSGEVRVIHGGTGTKRLTVLEL